MVYKKAVITRGCTHVAQLVSESHCAIRESIRDKSTPINANVHAHGAPLFIDAAGRTFF